MKKQLRIPPNFLALGYSAFDRPLVSVAGGSYDLVEISARPLNFLDDLRSEHLVFARFEDEMIDISDGTQAYAVFGTDPDHLYAMDAAGIVHAVSVATAEKTRCNRSLRDFARAHNLYASEICRLRADLLPDITGSHIFDALRRAGERLRAALTEMDESCIAADTYWNLKIERLTEGGITLFSGLETFVAKGRITL